MISAGDLVALENVSRNGSPGLLYAVGRLVGLGEDQRAALVTDGIPGWTWLLLGTAVGFIAGARVQRAWPEKLPEIVRGK